MLEKAIKVLFAVSIAAGSIAATLAEYRRLVSFESIENNPSLNQDQPSSIPKD